MAWLPKPWALSHYKDHLSSYGDFHHKDKTVVRWSFLYNGNPHTDKTAYGPGHGSAAVLIVTWFCYQLKAKPGNKRAAPPSVHDLIHNYIETVSGSTHCQVISSHGTDYVVDNSLFSKRKIFQHPPSPQCQEIIDLYCNHIIIHDPRKIKQWQG